MSEIIKWAANIIYAPDGIKTCRPFNCALFCWVAQKINCSLQTVQRVHCWLAQIDQSRSTGQCKTRKKKQQQKRKKENKKTRKKTTTTQPEILGVYLVWCDSTLEQLSHGFSDGCCILLAEWDIYMPSQIVRIMGPIWVPPGADRTQVGPMLAPWTLLSGLGFYNCIWVRKYPVSVIRGVRGAGAPGPCAGSRQIMKNWMASWGWWNSYHIS